MCAVEVGIGYILLHALCSGIAAQPHVCQHAAAMGLRAATVYVVLISSVHMVLQSHILSMGGQRSVQWYRCSVT